MEKTLVIKGEILKEKYPDEEIKDSKYYIVDFINNKIKISEVAFIDEYGELKEFWDKLII